MEKDEQKIIATKELESVSGGAKPVGNLCRVYSLDGNAVNMYDTTYDGYGPFWTAPNGAEMKVDPNIQQYPDIDEHKCSPFYWAYYRRWLKIKVEEVRLEWL